MKINVNGIDIEGTPEEVAQMIQAMNSNSQSVSKASNLTFVSAPVPTEDIFANIYSGFDDFIKALYRYKPDRYSQNGKAPYVIKLLATGEVYTIKNLMRLSSANQTVVSSAIRRAAEAGCVIETSAMNKLLTRNTQVRMLSLGTPEQAKSVQHMLRPSRAQKPQARIVMPKTTSDPNKEALLTLLKTKTNQK